MSAAPAPASRTPELPQTTADFLRTNSLHADSLDGASRPVSRLKPVARARAGTCISLCTLLGLMSLMSAPALTHASASTASADSAIEITDDAGNHVRL